MSIAIGKGELKEESVCVDFYLFLSSSLERLAFELAKVQLGTVENNCIIVQDTSMFSLFRPKQQRLGTIRL